MPNLVMQSPSDASDADIPRVAEQSDADAKQAELQAALGQMVIEAVQHADGALSQARAKAERYYNAEPFGNEEENRSKIVMSVVRDTVLQVVPSLIRIFFGAYPAVEYGPVLKEQIKLAEHITRYVLDVVLQQDNPGLIVYHDWFKDALLKGMGVVKSWRDEGTETRSFSVLYQSYDQILILASDDTVTIDEVRPCEYSPPGADLYDCDYTQQQHWKHIRVVCVPPEEYIYTPGSRSTDNAPHMPGAAPFVAHRTEMTKGQLLSMGIEQEDIDAYAFPDTSLQTNAQNIARQPGGQKLDSQEPREENKTSLYIEAYPFLMLDGDTAPRLYKVIMLGPGYQIIGKPEPAARRPFSVLCPDPKPHQVEGGSLADLTMDIQDVTSAIWRSTLDSLVLALNPRIAYVDGEVSLEDLMNMDLGAPIRTRSAPANALQVIEHNFVGAASLPVLEAIQKVLKNRVGVDDASSGLTADAMQSTTAMAVAAAQSKAQEHIELFARIFAETGVKQLFRHILELIVENPDPERMVRVNGEYIAMDPRSWSANLDVRINVPIGAGTTAERVAALQESVAAMEALLQVLGPENPAFSVQQYVDQRQRILKLRGFTDAEMMWGNASYSPPPPDPNAQDPNMVIAQAEAKKAEADVYKKGIDVEVSKAKHEVEVQRAAEDLKLREREMELQDQREREKMQIEAALQIEEMNLKYGAQITVAQVKARAAQVVGGGSHTVTRSRDAEGGESVTVTRQRDGEPRE
jgi:hypothetical protein